MNTYPISLIGLEARRSVVIGGGTVATRKVAGLLAAGAAVTVISPALTPELERLVEAGEVRVLRRSYLPGDLEGAYLVIAATDDPTVNHAVWDEANRCGCLINVVDDPAYSNFIVPAIVRRGEITLVVSTGGASPALARRLRERLESLTGPEYGALAELLAELRPEIMARFPAGEARLAAALRLVDSDVLEIIRQDGVAAARQRLLALLDQPLEKGPCMPPYSEGSVQPSLGIVYLVGAGPGDPELITVRGLKCLQRADVVV